MNRMSWHERTCMCACFLMLGFLAWAIPNQAEFAAFVWEVLP